MREDSCVISNGVPEQCFSLSRSVFLCSYVCLPRRLWAQDKCKTYFIHLHILSAKHSACHRMSYWKHACWAFAGGSVVKNPPSNAGDVGCLPGWETKITHVWGPQNPRAATRDAYVPQGRPSTARKKEKKKSCTTIRTDAGTQGGERIQTAEDGAEMVPGPPGWL